MFADPVQAVFREIERELPWSDNGAASRNVAPLSMWDDGTAVYVEMDVPGIALNDLDVSVEKGKLTIRGERKPRDGAPEAFREERFFGQFERHLVLNDWVDPTTIEATLQDGVLRLKLSRKPESQRQRIAIRNQNDDAKRIEASQ
jgi:HSP20 family protein